MQGRNGGGEGEGLSGHDALSPSFLAFTPFRESPHVPTTIHGPTGSRGLGSPIAMSLLTAEVSYSQGLLCLNIPTR